MEHRVGYPLAKPTITTEEIERRRAALREADASGRIEGLVRTPESEPVYEAFVRGEIALHEIIPRVKALHKRR